MTELTIIIGYLALLLGLGVVSNRFFRGTSQDYLLASHSIGPFLLLMSLFGTTMTAFALVGSTAKSYQVGIGVYGLMASSSGIVHSLCFFLIGIPLWSLGRRHGYSTQIQFFRDRLESNSIGLLLFPILVGLIIPYLLIGILGGGATIAEVTKGAFETAFPEADHGVPRWLASLMICGVVLAYVFMGGMRGTAVANAFQTLVFMALGVVTFVVIANELGGKPSFAQNVQAATQLALERQPEMLTHAGLPRLMFLGFLFIPLSAGMFPHLFQHWLTARSAEAFKLPVVVHPLFIMLVWVPCVLVGTWAATATVDGTITGVRLVPESFDDPREVNKVLGFMVQRLSGPVLSGLLTAGILAAVMSSLDSQFLCIGTMFTEDLVLHYAGPNRVSDRKVVVTARAFIVCVVAVTYALSLLNPVGVFTLGIWCFSGFAALVPLVVAAIYWKRLTTAGAFASVLTMAACWVYFFIESDYARNPAYSFHGWMPVVPMFAAATAALVVVSLITKPPSESTLAKFFPQAKPQAGALDS